jgi:septal ring factor EnvC (AmiA/AmiB activator)
MPFSDPNSPETLELLERRLAERVGDRVERTLKIRYAGIIAAVLFVLGLAGYSWIENLVVKAIDPVSKDAERTMAEMNVQLDLARDSKRKLDALIEQINTDADAVQRRVESFQIRLGEQQEEFERTLESINDQLAAVTVRRR